MALTLKINRQNRVAGRELLQVCEVSQRGDCRGQGKLEKYTETIEDVERCIDR